MQAGARAKGEQSGKREGAERGGRRRREAKGGLSGLHATCSLAARFSLYLSLCASLLQEICVVRAATAADKKLESKWRVSISRHWPLPNRALHLAKSELVFHSEQR